MKNFLREYWLWILIPVVVVAVGIIALIWLGKSSESSNPFAYNVF